MSSYSNQPPPQYPYQGGDFGQSRPNKKVGIWIAVIIGILFFGGFVCCGGAFGFLYFGTVVLSNEVKGLVQDLPEVKEQIGSIQSFQTDFGGSLAEEDGDTFSYIIQGDRGSGKIVVKHITNELGDEELVSGELIMEDGRRFPLTIPPLSEESQ